MTVTLELAKAQCKVRHDDEDTLFAVYMDAAAGFVERFTSLHLDETEVVDRFNAFGDYLQLSRGPFLELTSIAYVDAAGDAQTVADARVQDGRVYAPSSAGWPAILEYSTIEVTYLAGFDVYNPAPPEFDQAQLLLICHWFENRGTVAVGSTTKELEFAVDALIGPFRLPVIA